MAKHLLYILQVKFSCSQEDTCVVKKLVFTVHSAGKALGPCLKLCSQSVLYLSSQADHIHCCISQQLIGPTVDIYIYI